MGAFKDLTGQQFGDLTVIELSPLKTKHKHLKWLCRCSCGIEKIINGRDLASGHTKSCGKCLAFKDITGKKFGKLTVIERSHLNKWGSWHWLCKCDCGNEKIASGTELRADRAPSCGCARLEKLSKLSTKHGLSYSRVYQTHTDIIQRCLNSNNSAYCNYGGRGITICKEWRTFEGFWEWAQSSGYTDELIIERIGVNGNYEPDNCIWIPKAQQSNNTRRTNYITYDDKTLSTTEWAEKTGINKNTLRHRLYTSGWSIEKALTTPVQKHNRK